MPVCDVCNDEVRWEDGYVLTTMDVATSDTYWEDTLKGQWSYLHDMDSNGNMLIMMAQQQASQSTGWLVCESCSAKFSFDRAQARSYARTQNSNPPGTGRVPAELAARAAANAWRKLYGKWPSSIPVAAAQGSSPAAPDAESATAPEETESADKIIEYACPHCGRKLRIPIQFAGVSGKCNHCQNNIVVPAIAEKIAGVGNDSKAKRAQVERDHVYYCQWCGKRNVGQEKTRPNTDTLALCSEDCRKSFLTVPLLRRMGSGAILGLPGAQAAQLRTGINAAEKSCKHCLWCGAKMDYSKETCPECGAGQKIPAS